MEHHRTVPDASTCIEKGGVAMGCGRACAIYFPQRRNPLTPSTQSVNDALPASRRRKFCLESLNVLQVARSAPRKHQDLRHSGIFFFCDKEFKAPAEDHGDASRASHSRLDRGEVCGHWRWGSPERATLPATLQIFKREETATLYFLKGCR